MKTYTRDTRVFPEVPIEYFYESYANTLVCLVYICDIVYSNIV